MNSFYYDPDRKTLHVEMKGFYEMEDLQKYRQELEHAILEAGPGISLLVDKRCLFTLPPDALKELKLIREFRKKYPYVKRCALVFGNKVTEMQFKRTYEEVGAFENEAFFTDIVEARLYLSSES